MRKILYSLALVGAALLMSGNAYAQCPDFPALGDIYICYFVNGQKVVTLPGGSAPTNSSGGAKVQVAGFNYNPCQVIFEVLDFNSQGNGEFGSIDANLVPTTTPTTLTAQDAASGNLFPADLDLNVGLKASGSALGQTYTSIGDLNLQATGITSLPLKGIDVKQTRPLEFVGEDGVVDFILEGTTVQLNP